MPRALLLTGGGGVGKTTTAQAIGGALTGAGHATGVLDLDAVAQFGGPARAAPSSGLRFSDHLRIDNLAAVWRTYRAAGADFLIASGPVFTTELRAAYTAALPDCTVQVVRIVTGPDLIAARTRSTRGPEWDLATALAHAETHQPVEDFTVRNDGAVADTAAEILTLAGWPGG
ncbi:hypothetical protein ACIA58_36130 [Kribbella sp. NPDC051586]|uniref:hypothetical protein n=1 Tax=Kribbella sp. NPDC051586 TaxID=3364118 RepID=UPI0037B534C1